MNNLKFLVVVVFICKKVSIFIVGWEVGYEELIKIV